MSATFAANLRTTWSASMRILDRATPQSLLVVNEMFASTTYQDAVLLSKEIMLRALHIGTLCVWVTFIDELSSISPQTVSMVSSVDRENPQMRTYKILRRPADGLAYALAIARKHGLTYEDVMARIKP